MRAATFVFTAFVIQQIGVPDERSCTGDCEIPVHVPVDAKNCLVLGFFRRFFALLLHGAVEVIGI